MRPLETCLLIGAALGLLGLFVPQGRARRRVLMMIVTVPALAVCQIGLEGARWQMYPAYALALALGGVAMRARTQSGGQPVRGTLALLGGGSALLTLVVAVALPLALPVFSFPKPTGPYAVGTLTYAWQDASRDELFTPDPGDRREIMAQVWYPAIDEPAAPRAPYLQHADAITPHLSQLFRAPGFLLAHVRYVTTHAVESAPIAVDRRTFPVLIYLSGLGGGRQLSLFQIEELVSQGYVVVGLDQPGAASAVRFPDGRVIPGLGRSLNPLIDQSGAPQTPTPTLDGQVMVDGIIPYFAQDASFALDQLALLNASDPQHVLAGHLNLDQVGLFGISLGAIVGTQACAQDARFKACLLMDAFVTTDALRLGLQQPSLWITRPAETMRLERERSGGWSENDIAITRDTMRAAYMNSSYESYFVEMPTMFHVNFTDAPNFSPIMAQLGLIGPIDPQRGFDIVNAYSVAFFDKVLQGKPAAVLAGQAFPEAHLESRRP